MIIRNDLTYEYEDGDEDRDVPQSLCLMEGHALAAVEEGEEGDVTTIRIVRIQRRAVQPDRALVELAP